MRPVGTSPQRSRALAPPDSACSDVVPRYLCPHPTSWALPRSHRSITSAEDSIIGRSATRRCSPEEDVLIGPQIQIARDELAALVDADDAGVPRCPADTLEGRHDVGTAIGATRIDH